MTDVSLFTALIAGLATFFAPCTFPFVPGYLAFVSGVSAQDLSDPKKVQRARRGVFFNGVVFVLGFSLTFVVMGLLVGLIGARVLAPYRLWLGRIGGLLVIAVGLMMVGIIRTPQYFGVSSLTAAASRFSLRRGGFASSFALGSAFTFGWTPCVGPVLGTIFLLASQGETAREGALVLSAFSAGLGVPFLLLAAGVGSAARVMTRISKYLPMISIISGVLLIFTGVMLVVGSAGLFSSYGYRILRFIDFEGFLLDFL